MGLLSCMGGQGYDDGSDAVGARHETPAPVDLRAPDPCAGCYAVNSAILSDAQGELLVATYFGASEQRSPIVRKLEGEQWQTLSNLQDGIVRDLWRSNSSVWGADGTRVWRVDQDTEEATFEGPKASSLWATSDNTLLALGQDRLYRYLGDDWSNEPLDIAGDFPLALRGAMSWDEGRDAAPLFLVGSHGAVSIYTGDGWTVLNDATLDVELKDAAARGDELWAVSGSDHPDGTTGPAMLHRFADGNWTAIERRDGEALLAVETTAEEVVAVGARRDETGTPHAAIWILEATGDVAHIELDLEVFLWDVSCDRSGRCVAVGSDNALVRVDDVR